MPSRKLTTFVPDRRAYHRHYGGALPVFRGTVYQEGYGLGNIFGSLFRSVLPILKTTAASAGKTLLRSGAQALGDIVSGERDVASALKHHSMEGLKNVGKDVLTNISSTLNPEQSGSGRRKIRKRRRIRAVEDIFDSGARPTMRRKKRRLHQ